MRRAGSDLNPNRFSVFAALRARANSIAVMSPTFRLDAGWLSEYLRVQRHARRLKRKTRGTGSHELRIEVSCACRGFKVLRRETRRLLNCATDSGHDG